MVLSIGMIVKNEEKYLERCLAALMPILENLDSELIIADTGSTDRTVEIAKKFTDKVYFFKWINDFSAARNFTLEKSLGDWFMFIDADEILQDCSDIIHFFKSGEYLKFSAASYIVRSFADVSDTGSYSDFRSVRLTKRFEDVAFCNPIHETLAPVYGPIKYLDLIADHYGYMFTDNGIVTEQAKEKSSRNLKLMLEQLNALGKDELPEFSVFNEIADCYEIINEYDKALEFIDKGLDQLDHSHVAICIYYNHKAIILRNLKRYNEVIDVCNEYFSPRNISRKRELATDILMYALRGEAYYRTNRFDKTIPDMISFLDTYKKYTSGRLNTNDLLYGPFKVKKQTVKIVFEMLFKSCIEEHKFNIANEYIKAFPIKELQSDHDYIFIYLCLRIVIMENTNYNGLSNLYDQLDNYNKNQLLRIIRWYIFKSKKPEEILNNFTLFSDTNKKASEIADIYNDFFILNRADSCKINTFISEYGTLGNIDILCIMMSTNLDISTFITSLDFDVYKRIHTFFSDYIDSVFVFLTYDIENISSDGLERAAEVYSRAMVESQQLHKDISKLFRIYGSIGKKWLGEHGSAENAAPDIRAAVIVSGIISARDSKDYKLCINEMRRLIKTFPEFSPIVKEYQEIIKKEVSPANSGNSKLAELATVVKANIRNMIRNGKLSAAESTLSELEKLCPSDPDIGRLRTAIANAAEGSGNIH